MGQYIYYCEVHRSHEYQPGVYKIVAENNFNQHWFPKLNKLITQSERVWKQGPKGGVRIIKNNIGYDMYPTGYVTNNDRWMREFVWTKLNAKPL